MPRETFLLAFSDKIVEKFQFRFSTDVYVWTFDTFLFCFQLQLAANAIVMKVKRSLRNDNLDYHADSCGMIRFADHVPDSQGC